MLSYVKQNFIDGKVLEADQLNAMDTQIALNEAALSNKQPAGDYALKSDIKVTSVNNKTGAITLTAADVGAQAAGNYLVTESDPTVPAWAKASTKPTYTASEVGALPADTVIPTSLPNPKSISVNGISYNGTSDFDATDTINNMIDVRGGYVSVKKYGAKGDGSTDDYDAFKNALENNRVVFVPGGTYNLSATLTIGANCRLELSQDTVLNFTQTSGACIKIRPSSTLNGKHAIIKVPYAFTGNVIDINTVDETERETPPYQHWDPMWKSGRYIYDVCILKPNSSNLHYSKDGTCSGTAIYMSASNIKDGRSDELLNYIWGAVLQGIRIAGAFTYGIQVINVDDTSDGVEDDAWNHDMRIEAVIQGCETGVHMTNCNGAHLAVTVQPSTAEDDSKYVKWGVYLNDCRFVDMASSFIWDWQVARNDSPEYQHIAMYGQCRGLVLSDPYYYETSTDIREQIYTDTPSNLDNITILQEPFTRWFKPIDGAPYFNNGSTEKRLITHDEMTEYFITDRTQRYTDVLSVATDKDGSVYNDIGYKNNTGYYSSNWEAYSGDTFYFITGFIPAKAGDVLRGEGLSFVKYFDGNCRISLFDSSYNFISGCSISAELLVNSGGNYYVTHEGTDNSFMITIKSTDGTYAINGNVAYVRLQLHRNAVGDYPVMSVNEEIKFTQDGYLADGIKVKGESIVITGSDGKSYNLTVESGGTIKATAIS